MQIKSFTPENKIPAGLLSGGVDAIRDGTSSGHYFAHKLQLWVTSTKLDKLIESMKRDLRHSKSRWSMFVYITCGNHKTVSQTINTIDKPQTLLTANACDNKSKLLRIELLIRKQEDRQKLVSLLLNDLSH